MKKLRKPKKLGLVLVGLTLIVSVFLLIMLLESWGGTTQPLPFNHKIHAENGLACEDCHPNFMEYASSGRPELEICASCHEEALTESEEEKRLMEYIQDGNEIEWVRLYRVPEDVYFSHRRHVAVGNVECAVCHGDIGESTRPPSKVRKMSMGKCMDCHEDQEANNDCIACHR
jgi:c(7)-type cytochrome triheme protein